MPWREGLSDQQIAAVEHIGCHARLLAGPGTGKTRVLTRGVLALVLMHGIDPNKILALTFTRVAAFQLRQKLEDILQPAGIEIPRVSTLHSFALRQLLRNTERIDALPQPLRIADDWEERNIIQEDLKERLQDHNIREIQELFDRLSADWETLDRENPDWEEQFPDPAFLGAWREHRSMYGYTLRSELVYQLKRALNQYPDFNLEDEFQHVLIDEYQDLNACDLEVIHELANRGCEIFVAGDDDQSIYGFRGADPTGIRRFTEDYQHSADFALETCYRCDKAILRIAEFVANLDPERLQKNTSAIPNAAEGEVLLMQFIDQYQEATSISQLCRYLIQTQNIEPGEILILFRSDRHNNLSSVIKQSFINHDVPLADYAETSPLDSNDGRLVLAILRLLVNNKDNLAWRTALQLRIGIGPACLRAAESVATNNNLGFSDALQFVKDNTHSIANLGGRISDAVEDYDDILEQLHDENVPLDEQIQRTTQRIIEYDSQVAEISTFLTTLIMETEAKTLSDLVSALSASLDTAEQELVDGAVNILTMHKAKGLSADVVFIVGAEDEYIPGRNEGQREGDERRLLFVSMTRARHHLYISYCGARIGRQMHSGRESGKSGRTLTRFLRDSPLYAENVHNFSSNLVNQDG